MTSTSLRLWRTFLAHALLWVVATLAQEDPYKDARHCYDCVYQVSTDSWAPCKGPIAAEGLSSQVVDAPHCFTNCFTKINKNGDIRRGCYDGTYGIDQNLIGCHTQGSDKALYCFCKGDRCNNSPHNVPSYNDTKTYDNSKSYNYDSQPTYIQDPVYEEYPSHNTEVHDVYEPSAREAPSHYNNVDYSPHPHDYNHDSPTYDYDYESSNYNQEPYAEPYDEYSNKHKDHKNGHEHYQRSKGKVKHNHGRDSNIVMKNDQRSYNHDNVDVVYGLEVKPIIHTRKSPIERIEHVNKEKDYEKADLSNYEHNVDVSTANQHIHDGTDIHGSRHGDDFDHHEHGGSDVTNEYVDHTHRQRQLQATHSIGKELEEIANIHPGAAVIEQPHIEHKQTQHFHKYDLGERTIEHHIVEHYVLHHRIKELLRNRHGLDVHNVDPRQVSLIYRLLHPHKAAEWDKEKALLESSHITE